jgi:phosphatidylinositol-3-phosphatase
MNTNIRTKPLFLSVLSLTLILACVSTPAVTPTTLPPAATVTPFPSLTASPVPTVATPIVASPTVEPKPLIPNFDHIVILIFENKEFGSVIGNSFMPNYNQLARDYTLLTQYYAVTHPSLPNYIAMMGGDTFGITENCNDCFIDTPSLPDLIEASGRTWKTYQEDLPSPCYLGDKRNYVQKHNPFVYFDPIRTDVARCERSVLPLTALQTDIETDSLPNFIFITPNLCNSAHDCSLDITDAWLANILAGLVPALDRGGSNYLIVLTWDEGQGKHSCCGLPAEAGGRVATVLYSPLVKNGFEDATPYSHYSLLKTISEAWGLPYLGHATEINHPLIVLPWK